MPKYTYGECQNHPSSNMTIERGYDETPPESLPCLLCGHGEQMRRIYKSTPVIYNGEGWANKDVKND